MNAMRFSLMKASCLVWLLSVSSSAKSFTIPSFLKTNIFKTNIFNRTPHEEVVDREYKVTPKCTLNICNLDGDISVKAEWKCNAICLKATKRTKKEEMLPAIEILENRKVQDNQTSLTITTACKDPNASGKVDYELIVPAHVALNLNTQNGNINLNEVHGPVVASTSCGDIRMDKTANVVTAHTEKSGSININRARGAVRATTYNGDINIHESHASVVANALNRGNIITACAQVPSTSTVQLNTAYGQIELSLPSEVNAMVTGRTERGVLTSDHFITIKPHATRLDKNAWTRFKREVDGVIGNGESTIKLSNARGNIKITKPGQVIS